MNTWREFLRNIDVNQMMKDMNGGHGVHQSFWWTYEVPSEDAVSLETLSYMLYLSVTCFVTCVFSIVTDFISSQRVKFFLPISKSRETPSVCDDESEPGAASD